jgi:hypothetical protein
MIFSGGDDDEVKESLDPKTTILQVIKPYLESSLKL